MSEKISVMISEDELEAKIAEMGKKISEDYAGEEVYIICILRGASFFACELAKRITVPVIIDFMATSSYGSGTVSSGVVTIKSDVEIPVEGKNVLIVEDIIDSGNTLHYLLDVFKDRNAKSVKLCTMLDKPSRREVHVDVDYTGFEIEDKFIVGYGLDYDGLYRNFPDVYTK